MITLLIENLFVKIFIYSNHDCLLKEDYMKINKLHLLSKGWSVSEIEGASSIIEDAENKKHIGIRFLDKTTYWTLLFLVILNNAVCSAFLIPFIFAVKGNFIIFIVTLLGFAFGTFFSILIANIQKTEERHLRSLIFALISSGVINFALISNISVDFSVLSGLELRHDPYLIAGIYLFAFLTPHAIIMIEQYRKQ